MDRRPGRPDTGPRVGGRYALVRRIARGGGGTVWEAHDEMLDRTVAVKEVEIPDELSDDERQRLRRRVLAEARAAARLEHPGVVVMHDVLDGDDTVHLVMEYVEAPTLRRLVDERGPLDEHVAAAVGFGLLDVLAEAHRRGVVHRDVKPSNVFVLDDGTVKLGDFGIAALTGEVSLTRTGVALGSPSYLAPEQARGESAAPPADLWGLGATLYYAVEGQPPFDRRTALATVHAVVNEPMRGYERADQLQPVLSALLDKDPARRPDLGWVRGQFASVAGLPATDAATEADAEQGPPADDQSAGRRWLAVAVALLLVMVATVYVLDRDGDTAPPLAEQDTGEDGETALDSDADDTDAADAEATETEPDDVVTETEPVDGGDDTAGEAEATDDAAGNDEPATDAQTDAGAEAEADADQGGDGGAAADGAAAENSSGYTVPESAPPDDWQVVSGETYQVAVPADWQRREVQGNRTDWVDPDTGAYLRVDWTDSPASDPVADWEQAEPGFAERQDNYRRIRLEPARYRNWDAAMWEYTYGGGRTLHAINLNVLADDLDHAFALNLQAPAGEWDRVARHFPAIAGSFEPQVGG